MAYKQKEREEAYRLYVEEGVTVIDDLCKRVGLSKPTVQKVIGPEAKKDHQKRCAEARRLYVEQGMIDTDAICAAARISPKLFRLIYKIDWDQARADYVAAHPVLYTTGQILQQAAETLLNSVRTSGYSDQNVKTFVTLANSFESFKTGEHRIEMAMVGLTDFADWFRANAKALSVSAPEVRSLVKVLDKFRSELLNKLRAIAQ